MLRARDKTLSVCNNLSIIDSYSSENNKKSENKTSYFKVDEDAKAKDDQDVNLSDRNLDRHENSIGFDIRSVDQCLTSIYVKQSELFSSQIDSMKKQIK